MNGAEVVETVEQLDDEDPDVLGHRHHHLPNRGRLCLFPIRVADPVELGDTVDETGDLLAELDGEIGQVECRVFDGVMEKAGGQGRLVEAVLGEHQCDCHRVGDEGIPCLSYLPLVRRRRNLVGPGKQLLVPIGVMVHEGSDDIFECRLPLISRR
jgi:hypothetical protein